MEDIKQEIIKLTIDLLIRLKVVGGNVEIEKNGSCIYLQNKCFWTIYIEITCNLSINTINILKSYEITAQAKGVSLSMGLFDEKLIAKLLNLP